MVPTLRAHVSHLALEDFYGASERNLGLFVPLVGDDLTPLGLASDLGFGGSMLMMFASLDVDDHVDQILPSLSQLADARLRPILTIRIQIRHHVPLNIHQAASPSVPSTPS